VIHEKTAKLHNEKDLKKQLALLNYKKLTLIKERQPTKEVDQQLAKLSKGEMPIPPMDKTIVNNFVSETAPHINDHYRLFHMKNITTFLASQREYQELLERYNPGLSMEQQENITKSANRVGLQVPQ